MLHFTDHARQRLAERGIHEWEARAVIDKGKVIRQDGQALRLYGLGLVVVLNIVKQRRQAVATVITAWRT